MIVCRWASARKGGMKVLGKVAVPKPINLPSQRYLGFFSITCGFIWWGPWFTPNQTSCFLSDVSRLENHGLDPNVEIVPKWVIHLPFWFFDALLWFSCYHSYSSWNALMPLLYFFIMNLAQLDLQFLPNLDRGTHSWGTRSSSSTPNAWGSSTLSPNTDGGSGSPSHLSGRPSSGGSGTRPSTASSDRTHEPITNAWGSNSRPSSASGALTSNQTSPVLLRPRSAETRPGSSQLSRFAEPLSDNPVAWGTTGTAEKLV